MRIFMTGATGVVGRRAIPLLVAAGHQVTAIGRTPEKQAGLERMGATALALDLFDPAAVRNAVAGHDVVVNLATHIPGSSVQMMLPWSWRENDRIRRDASAILVEAASAGGVSRLIQESFAPIYADAGEAWIDEEAPVRPLRYNRTVLDAERAAAGFTQRGGVGVVLRFALFYGPDSKPTQEMIPVVRKGWAPMPGLPGAFLSSVSHDDAATAVVAALGVPAGIYNVADDEPLRRSEFFGSLADALGVPPPKLPPSWITPLFGAMGEMLSRSLRISNRKLRDASGWAPKYPSVREGWQAVA
ncbi:MAG TPA: NAD(P)-dependent oxidoreductase [Rhodothermales bacterium]|nr:NAD(P)-dependent oxidoreductase [Rhodothermales bacterium]